MYECWSYRNCRYWHFGSGSEMGTAAPPPRLLFLFLICNVDGKMPMVVKSKIDHNCLIFQHVFLSQQKQHLRKGLSCETQHDNDNAA